MEVIEQAQLEMACGGDTVQPLHQEWLSSRLEQGAKGPAGSWEHPKVEILSPPGAAVPALAHSCREVFSKT